VARDFRPMTPWPPGPLHAGAMHSSHCKEDLSVSYVRAVATSIGVACDELKRDINGCDVLIRSEDTPTDTAQSLSVQLKCTVNRLHRSADGSEVVFPLRRIDHEHLRRRDFPPRVLVVVEVPAHVQHSWVEIASDELVLKASAWWTSLEGQPALPAGQNTVNVRIPASSYFNAAALHANMRSPF
jgi:hypothetical protein